MKTGFLTSLHHFMVLKLEQSNGEWTQFSFVTEGRGYLSNATFTCSHSGFCT